MFFFYFYVSYWMHSIKQILPSENIKNALMQNNESKHASLTNEYHTVP